MIEPTERLPGDRREAARLAELASYGPCLDLTDPLRSDAALTRALDGALRLSTLLCAAPDGAVAIVAAQDVRLLARLGPQAHVVAAGDCVSRHCIDQGQPLLAADARLVPALADKPMVRAPDGIRFCAMVPLITPRGHAIGALCVTDRQPRQDVGAAALAALVDLAGLIVDVLEQRRQAWINQTLLTRTALLQRLMRLAADAADFPDAAAAATRCLCEATGGLLCHLWRLAPNGQRAHLLRGWGVGAFGSADYLARVADTVNDDPASPTLVAMLDDRQVVVEDLQAGPHAPLPLFRMAAALGLRQQISTPLRLGKECFALVLGLGDGRHDLGALAGTLDAAAEALRPLLRRIRDEEERLLLQRVVDETSDVVLITEAEPVDLPGPRIVYVNPAFEKQTGYTSAEVLGLTPRILQGPQSSPRAMANIRAALESWQPVRQALLNYRKDGSRFWSDLQITPIADAQGWYTHWVAIQRDVTKELEAQRARIQAVRELNQLIAQMPGTLIRLRRRAEGGWQRFYVAPSMMELTGYSAEEASAAGWLSSRAEPGTLSRIEQETQRAAGGAHLTSLFRLRHRSGRWLWIRAIKRGQVAADGQPEVVAIWSDVTVEHDLADQLAHAARLAQLGEVTTGLAHELNQPLASISLAAENAARYMAAAPPALDRVRAKLELIVEQTQRASGVLDHMRIFGRTEPQPVTAVRLEDVLARARTMVRGKLAEGSVTLAADGLGGLPPVLAAAIPLEQVLVNLIVNACDAYAEAPPGLPRRIDILARPEGDTARILVCDHAGGIPPEALPRIFQPFFTTKPAGQGTGLGLSISYGILAAMGGSITVANAEGGACFTLVLPLAPAGSR